jgi:hypothetical protein
MGCTAQVTTAAIGACCLCVGTTFILVLIATVIGCSTPGSVRVGAGGR